MFGQAHRAQVVVLLHEGAGVPAKPVKVWFREIMTLAKLAERGAGSARDKD